MKIISLSLSNKITFVSVIIVTIMIICNYSSNGDDNNYFDDDHKHTQMYYMFRCLDFVVEIVH